MPISPIRLYGTNYPNFKSNIKNCLPKPVYKTEVPEGLMLTKEGNLYNRSTTNFFRTDLNWSELGKYLKSRFKNNDKVNVYIWGCSTGQEAYSLSMILKRMLPDDDKFFPIFAMDVDKKIIEQNIQRKNKGIVLKDEDIERIYRNLALNANISDKYIDENYIPPRMSKNIVDSVRFSFSNIVTDVDKIADNSCPSVVMCRNMWPYIEYSKYDETAKKLYSNLASGSIVVIGDFDITGDSEYNHSSDFPKYLIKNGFKPNNYAVGYLPYEAYENKNLIYEKPF